MEEGVRDEQSLQTIPLRNPKAIRSISNIAIGNIPLPGYLKNGGLLKINID